MCPRCSRRHDRDRRPASAQAQAVPRHSDREPTPVPGRRGTAIAKPWSAPRPRVAHLVPGPHVPGSSLVAPRAVIVFLVVKVAPTKLLIHELPIVGVPAIGARPGTGLELARYFRSG